jgi:HSP90 family molecular chaperone
LFIILRILLFYFSLHLKEEAAEYLEQQTLDEIIRKYSQFINFNIYLWKSKTTKEEVVEDDGMIILFIVWKC